MTFSVVARCAETGQLGIAISSSSIAVGARCPWLRPGVGAVASQNITLPSLGPQVLERLAQGVAPSEALAALAEQEHSEYRQVTVIDHLGRTAHFSGARTLGVHHAVSGEQCVAAGNMLANPGVIEAMVRAFERAPGHLADRLLAAMHAALAEGGEAGPVHSAALVVVDDVSWPIVNLRVDWADAEPIDALDQLWQAYRPQLQDYIDRALNPPIAPGYDVPGDDR
ncbi:fimbrial assembly protein FimA [Pseudomonas fluorescens ABAC62]|nr:fimbrial assembly protein FimA [Pseudomonas fluorescens ABAC62]